MIGRFWQNDILFKNDLFERVESVSGEDTELISQLCCVRDPKGSERDRVLFGDRRRVRECRSTICPVPGPRDARSRTSSPRLSESAPPFDLGLMPEPSRLIRHAIQARTPYSTAIGKMP